MSNLRSLISYADKARFTEIVGAASSTTAYWNHGSEYKQMKWFVNYHNGHGRTCYMNCMRWVAPKDTKYVKFEIWGGGGSSPTVQCCMFGMGGGAGAYAYKELCCREYGDLSQKGYEITLAYGSCQNNDCCGGNYGFSGCKTYINGYGLCNFCAEGGIGGWGLCFCNDGWFMCGTQDESSFNNFQPSGGWNGTSSQSINQNDCGPIYPFCGFDMFAVGNEPSWRHSHLGYHFPGCSYGKHNKTNREECEWDLFDDGYLNKKYRVGLGNTFGSQCGRVNPNHTHVAFCYGQTTYLRVGSGQCAHYYGADGGAYGLPPMFGSPCDYTSSNPCMARQYVPFPGGLLNDRGGYIIHRTNTQACCGPDNCFCQNNWTCLKWQRCTQGFAFGLGGSSPNQNEGHPSVPGQPGWNSWSCNCYSPNGIGMGMYGAGGQVIITYYND
jgi:hypothetical protein